MTLSRTLTSRWIFPVTGPPLPNGVVTLNGTLIEAVSPRGNRLADEDLGNAAIIPGLVNAHTHLDLSGARKRIPPTDPEHFTDWLRGVIAFRRTRTPEQVQADIREGLAECLRAGTTLIGDITANGDSWDALSQANVRTVVFRELIGLSEERANAATEAGWRWSDAHPATETCRAAFSPHSPYSARESLLTEGDRRFVLAIHLGQSPGELELLKTHTGPFVSFLQQLGAWDESGLVRSIDRIIDANRQRANTLFIHCNYLQPEVANDFDPSMSIVYCPRTHADFRHPPHPFREFLARGVRVCLGTDSLASNPDLDVLAEARFVHQKEPDFPRDQLLRMVTLSGAEALGWSDVCGSLEAGKSADLVAIPLPDRDGDPHELLMSDEVGHRRTLFRGEWRE